MLPVSDWLTEKSKDPLINTVWSACVVDMDTKSKHINKTANECSREELWKNVFVKYEMQIIVYQFLIKQQCLMVLFVLIINGNQRILVLQGRKYEYLPMQGNISNLFALGCFTEGVMLILHNLVQQ